MGWEGHTIINEEKEGKSWRGDAFNLQKKEKKGEGNMIIYLWGGDERDRENNGIVSERKRERQEIG